MKSVNVIVLGDNEFAKELGKKGTVTDFTIYNYKGSDMQGGELTATFLVPTSYPDKLQSLTHCLAMADAAILVVKKLDRELGEFIIALDLLGINKGLIIFDEYVEKDKFVNMVRGTVLESFIIVDKSPAEVYPRLAKMEIKKPEIEHVVIDAAFDVKSVGTVVLGVARGSVNVHDEFGIYPGGKKVTVRSIQVHDKDVKSAETGERVGLALKGVSVEEVERGHLFSKQEIKSAKEIEGSFTKNKYYTEEIKENSKVFLAAHLQYRQVDVVSNSEGKIRLKSEKEIALIPGNEYLILKPEAKVRIVGKIKI
ncbi:MAG: hypothetical protein N3G74_01790 [Candidatus Micrarchaeota archaeon]|nr:hypothetical protein [Candidatus Micrarchaeota archaeon]